MSILCGENLLYPRLCAIFFWVAMTFDWLTGVATVPEIEQIGQSNDFSQCYWLHLGCKRQANIYSKVHFLSCPDITPFQKIQYQTTFCNLFWLGSFIVQWFMHKCKCWLLTLSCLLEMLEHDLQLLISHTTTQHMFCWPHLSIRNWKPDLFINSTVKQICKKLRLVLRWHINQFSNRFFFWPWEDWILCLVLGANNF